MRWFNGSSVCVPPIEVIGILLTFLTFFELVDTFIVQILIYLFFLQGDAPQSRRDLVYQLLAMDSNIAATNIIYESKKQDGSSQNKKARKSELGGQSKSNTASSSSNA